MTILNEYGQFHIDWTTHQSEEWMQTERRRFPYFVVGYDVSKEHKNEAFDSRSSNGGHQGPPGGPWRALALNWLICHVFY